MAQDLAFDIAGEHERAEAEPAFLVDVDGFEGPLDLLLELARRQKVDLARISILALAEQYLAFVEEARRVRLELAADYLVMAAWLAYLKSRLLLPEQPKTARSPPPPISPPRSPIGCAGSRRSAPPRTSSRSGRGSAATCFCAAGPRGSRRGRRRPITASLYDLLSAYARQRQKQAVSRVTLRQRNVWSLAEARETLERLAGIAAQWTALDDYLLDYCVDIQTARTVRASSFSASLEMVREGRFDIRQDRAFAPIWLRRRETELDREPSGSPGEASE